jgi:hypothetical protein
MTKGDAAGAQQPYDAPKSWSGTGGPIEWVGGWVLLKWGWRLRSAGDRHSSNFGDCCPWTINRYGTK